MRTDIDSLIGSKQYTYSTKQKNAMLTDILSHQLAETVKTSSHVRNFYSAYNFKPEAMNSLEDIPPIPVSMFKINDMYTCDKSSIVRILESSGTTKNLPSKIYIDKITAFRQSKALTSILSSFLGERRRPLLVIDAADTNRKESLVIKARAAGIRGFANFATTTTYALNSSMDPDIETVNEFIANNTEAIIFGFTFIVWSSLIKKLSKPIDMSGIDAKLVHSGGWKKLADQNISKENFDSETSRMLNMSPKNVINFYGMVESLGSVFVDCEEGFKHTPNFAEIIVRDQHTFKPNDPGRPGLIEVVSVLPNSYPGHALLTDDVGVIYGEDDCRCGRTGKYFKFISRAEKSELRGCGDTFLEAVA